MDFVIALLLFIFTVVVYFSYTNNFQTEDQGEINSMLSDAKAISSSLTLSGYPSSWDNTTVIRIGIADDQRINTTKLKNFKQLNYSLTKKKFGTVYDYFVFFVGNNGSIINITDVCGVGSPLINAACTPVNLTGINKQKLVKTERYLNYNSQVMKMVVYVWQ